jgi:hypothetical protein
MLIITDLVIESRPYHNRDEGVTWETSDIRRYLNDEFYNKLTEADRVRIRETTIVNDNNPWTFEGRNGSTPGGNDTTDKIFLLSIDEIVRYFGDSGMLEQGKVESERLNDVELPNYGFYWWGFHDQFSETRIAYNIEGMASWWWLRSPGIYGSFAADVDPDGNVLLNGGIVSASSGGVRPALWLNLSS